MIKKFKTANREEWKALRHRYIGGSDAATVVGLNPFSSPYKLWAEKTDKVEPFGGNIATETGTYLEEFVAKLFERETGKRVKRNNFSMVNDKYPFAIANIDREVVGEDAGLEIKTTSELNLTKFKGGEFPANYYCQCMHYMAVTEKSRWYLAVLIGNRELKIFCIERDEDEIANLMMAEEKFFRYIQEDEAPPVDGAKATSEAIGAMYPNSSDDEMIDITSLDRELSELSGIRDSIKTLEKREAELENAIKEYMQTASVGVASGYKVTYKTQSRNTFQAKDFAKDHPDIDLSGYYKTSTSRPLKVTAVKKGA